MQGRFDSNNNPEIRIARASIMCALLIEVGINCMPVLIFAFIFISIIVIPYTAEIAPQRIQVFVKMGSRYQGLKITSGRSKLHYAWAPLFIGVWILLYFITTIAFHSLPHPIKINEAGNGGQFIAERALKDLLDLTKIGPRVVGSPANEQVAMKFLIERVDAIRQLMNTDLFIMETDVQIASGSYVLEKSVNMYQAIQNFVVKLSWKHSNSSSSLLINSHFDTVPGSPGAGDDGTMVVVMIEILRILAQSSEPFQHSLVFLFNGAEENPLQGSHAFITQHKWASNVKAFINLDSAGNGGKEVLFQSAPNHPWLMQYYKDNAVHPYANTMAEELFQKGFIPSDTDFRIFRDYGRIPGLDFAHSYNDYVYHTKYDRFEIVPPGTIQNTGDNILAMARTLSNAPELVNPMAQDEGQTIFFDFVNVFLVIYPDHVGLIINISISVIALVLISISLWWMSDNSGVTLMGVLGRFAITFLLQIASIILAACLSIALAFIFDLSNLSLSWFSQPWLIFGLYFCPFYFVLSIIPAIYLHVTRENALLLNHRVQLFLHAQAIYLIIILLVLTFLNIRSAYIIMIAVFFYDISLTINLVSTMHNKQLLWILPHLISQIFPVIFFAYLSHQFYTNLIPMQGRAGSEKNPELLICGASILFGLLIGGFLVPLISIFRKSALIACSFLLVAFIFIIVTVTPIGFPYTAETAPQRLQIFHTKRIFHDVDQTVKSSDSGFFILPVDRNIWTIPDYILNASQIRNKNEFCHDSFNCGLPVYNFRRSQLSNNIIWVPAGEPNLIKEPKFELLSKEPKRDNVIRYTFSLSGPDHMTILISPMSEIKLVNWSFTEIPFQSWGSPYFVSFSYAIDPNPLKFSLDFQTPPHWNGSVFNIALTGHLTHHRIHHTPEFKEFLTTFPTWTYPYGWMSSVEHWIM